MKAKRVRGVLVALGAVAATLTIGVAVGLAVINLAPATAVAGVVSSPWAEYTPSPVEIAIIVGAFAFFALVYTLAERYLPMGEHEGHLVGAFLGSTEHPGGTREEPSDPVPTPEPVLAPAPVPPPEPVLAPAPVPPATPTLDPAGGAL